MLFKQTNKSLPVLALNLDNVSMSAFAAVYELPADGLGVVGTDNRIRLRDQEGFFGR